MWWKVKTQFSINQCLLYHVTTNDKWLFLSMLLNISSLLYGTQRVFFTVPSHNIASRLNRSYYGPNGVGQITSSVQLVDPFTYCQRISVAVQSFERGRSFREVKQFGKMVCKNIQKILHHLRLIWVKMHLVLWKLIFWTRCCKNMCFNNVVNICLVNWVFRRQHGYVLCRFVKHLKYTSDFLSLIITRYSDL